MQQFLEQTQKDLTQNNGLMQNDKSACLVPFSVVLEVENVGRGEQECFVT